MTNYAMWLKTRNKHMTHDTRAKWFMRDAKRDYVGPQYSETAMVGAASLGFAVGFGFAVLLLWVMSMDAV